MTMHLLARILPRRIPRVALTLSRNTSSLKEGSVAQSKEFSKKEKAHEDEYMRRRQAEQLQKLREDLDAANVELQRLKQEVEAAKQNSK